MLVNICPTIYVPNKRCTLKSDAACNDLAAEKLIRPVLFSLGKTRERNLRATESTRVPRKTRRGDLSRRYIAVTVQPRETFFSYSLFSRYNAAAQEVGVNYAFP